MQSYKDLVCVGIINDKKSGLRKALLDGTIDTLGLVLVNKHTLERSVVVKSVKELVQNGMLDPEEKTCIDGIHTLINGNRYGLVDTEMNVRRMTYTILAIQKNLGKRPGEDFCPTCVVADPTGYTFEVNLHSEYFNYGRYNTEFCKRIINLSSKSDNINGIKVTDYIKPHDYTNIRPITLSNLLDKKMAIIAPYNGKINQQGWFAEHDDVYKADFEKIPTQWVLLPKQLRIARPDYRDIVIDPIAPSIIDGAEYVRCRNLIIGEKVVGIAKNCFKNVDADKIILCNGVKYLGPGALNNLITGYIEIPLTLEYAYKDNFRYINHYLSDSGRKRRLRENFEFNCKHPLIKDRGYKSGKESVRRISELAQKYGR